MSSEDYDHRMKKKQERGRRETALANRQSRVEDEKRRQKGVLKHSIAMLREKQLEFERANKVGKEGLLGYRDEENATSPGGLPDS